MRFQSEHAAFRSPPGDQFGNVVRGRRRFEAILKSAQIESRVQHLAGRAQQTRLSQEAAEISASRAWRRRDDIGLLHRRAMSKIKARVSHRAYWFVFSHYPHSYCRNWEAERCLSKFYPSR